MKQLYDHIKAKIEADLTDIKTVRLWRNQYSSYNIDKMESVFRYPAIFIEFTPTEYFEYKQYRDVDLIVRFHVGIENYMIEKEEDLDLIDKIDRAFKGFRGNTDDAVNFTTFEKIVESDDPDDDNVNLIIVEYKTRFREIDSLPGDTIVVDPVTLDLTAEIVSEIKNPPFAVRCIAANNEYLSSPVGSYFPSTVADLNIRFEYQNYEENIGEDSYFIKVGKQSPTESYMTLLYGQNFLIFILNDDDLNQGYYLHSLPSGMSANGSIEFKGNGTDLELYLNDLLVETYDASGNTTLNNLNTFDLYFHAWHNGTSLVTDNIPKTIDDIFIKINSHEWTSPNWKSPITTNSQGVQTTLHSDDNTDAMIIEI